jgi:hypothetical protein
MSRMTLNHSEVKYSPISPSPLHVNPLVRTSLHGACALIKRLTKAWYPVASKLCILAENRGPKNELD